MNQDFDKKEVLVLVHPGSACGSANFNIGKFEARAARDELVYTLDSWKGSVLVIDGELSDELPDYPLLNNAITTALDRAKEAGFIAERVMGHDPKQVERIQEFVAADSRRAALSYQVTGAWFTEGDGPDDGMCVGSVHKALLAMGCKAAVHESAVDANAGEDDWPTER